MKDRELGCILERQKNIQAIEGQVGDEETEQFSFAIAVTKAP